MPEDHPAPFIPSRADEIPVPPGPWRLMATPSYFRLWLAQVISSTGDWIGLIAILAIAARVSDNSGAAVSVVIAARVIPGFFLGTVGGVLIDRLDRRKVMVTCDLGRASLLALLPFVESILGLVLISFGLEILTLLWGPAKDAAVPGFVESDQLASANTFSLVASYATFPLASIIFSLLAAMAGWLGAFEPLRAFKLDQEVLALLVDACTFVASAVIVWQLPIGRPKRRRRADEEHVAENLEEDVGQKLDEEGEAQHESRVGRTWSERPRIDWTQTLRDIKEGLSFIAAEPRVRGIIIGLGLGIIGGGAMVPLGPVFAKEALGADSAGFGVLMTALGLGTAVGVVLLMIFQRKLPREVVFEVSLMSCGALLALAASFSSLAPATFVVALVGACAGTAYVTGFTALQETVYDEIRGRTFATLYTVIRMCLLLALVVAPLWADFWNWFIGLFTMHHIVTLAGVRYRLPGVRVALWGGGLITFSAGWWARHSVVRTRRQNAAGPGQDEANGS